VDAEDDRSYRPRWLRWAPFLGRPPELTRRQWRVLGLVAIVSLFEQYDVYLLSLSLKQIQADLGIAEAQLGLLGSLVRSGSLFAVCVTLLADRLGRRRVLVWTVMAYTLFTGATAFAPGPLTFLVFQFLSRVFSAAETFLAVVVIAEEFDAKHRGWGIGALGALQACGAGVAALAFGLVDVLPFGWRALYAVGLGPLLLIAWWRRTLPETPRFAALERERAAAATGHTLLAPARALARSYPGRFAALALAVFALEAVVAPAAFFAPKFLQDVHGWRPASVAGLTLVGGAFAIVASPLAGWLSDRSGRKPVTVLFALAFVIATVAFYRVHSELGPALWVLMIFGLLGSQVILSAYGAELFPTSQRSTASGARGFFSTAGAVSGLALVSLLFGLLGSNWLAIVSLSALALLTPLAVALFFPETAGRSLEEIAPER
jgi:MFS family permease